MQEDLDCHGKARKSDNIAHRLGTPRMRIPRSGGSIFTKTFALTRLQRGPRPFSGDALLIDRQLFSGLPPEDLFDLPMPPRGEAESEKLEYERALNRRAAWRQVRHAGPDP